MGRDGYRVAVVGATGAVGSTVVRMLEERRFPVRELVPFASARSVGKAIEFDGRAIECVALSEEALRGFDLAFAAAGGEVSEEWTPRFAGAGALVIDKSSVFRMEPDIPLVVAEVNPDEATREARERKRGIVANPNCSTMQMVVALNPIYRSVGIEEIVVATYQSVSGTGRNAIEEMWRQSRQVLDEQPVTSEVYPHQIAFNVLPQVETFKDDSGFTTEELKMRAETRKILGAGEELAVTATCVRVPVPVGHSEAVTIRTREQISAGECRELLSGAPGVQVLDDPMAGIYPLAIDAAGQDEVLVGRVRNDLDDPRRLSLWVVGDNLRKGAATNAVQIAELLHEAGLLGRQREGAPAASAEAPASI